MMDRPNPIAATKKSPARNPFIISPLFLGFKRLKAFLDLIAVIF